MIRCLIETEKKDFRDPLFAGPRRAAYAHLSCWYPYRGDPIAPLAEQIPGVYDHLKGTPPDLRALYLPWFAEYETAAKGNPPTPAPDWTKKLDDAIPRRQAEYIARELAVFGLIPILFDFENNLMDVGGRIRPQADRTSYLRRASAPLAKVFGERSCTGFVRIKSDARVLDGNGVPVQSGTIDNTSAVPSMSRSRAEWGRHRRDVRACRAPACTHLPPIWTDSGKVIQDPDEMLSQLYGAILLDSAAGVRTFILAMYMIERKGPSGRDLWAEAMKTVDRAIADAEAAIGEVG
jgi:hypothetical protein